MDKVHRLAEIDSSWTLFLDRDGVINRKIEYDYVKNIREFEILPGVLESLYHFDQLFNKIIIVTNQQGIGKELYTHHDLDKVHQYMTYLVEEAHGRIDAIYYCPHLAGTCTCRKPSIGMGLNAKNDFPSIDFSKSIMVGDSDSDIGFAKQLNILAVKILSTNKNNSPLIAEADIFVPDLLSFAKLILKYKN
jgi:D-glycero-D-manno-heptose 1,7-bisphosphate phosphatase